ncbi:cache domain-containing protein [Desulfosporosinus sp. PR]|uniref:cache domain-containing protein n=1 Tax=Candidatus Desulfosporosinus nitrosoreducens TaxID=3401928 RepID=UPI0027FD2D10|nr:cache domain-containing protein [Desulfosporosinus sp. PR]MDQ7096639.1 cache domain-containing protein [Desulfosporosinus sp. PR]
MVKWFFRTIILVLLLISITGCSKEPQVQPTTLSSTGTSQLTDGHPAETSTQPGNKETIVAAETKINNFLTKTYPGDWNVAGTTLSKGTYTENGNYKIVDGLENQFTGTMGVSIFVGNQRISTSVKQGASRVLNYPTPAAVGKVMASGASASTLSSGYLNVYIPLKSDGKTIAVLTVSTPES